MGLKVERVCSVGFVCRHCQRQNNQGEWTLGHVHFNPRDAEAVESGLRYLWHKADWQKTESDRIISDSRQSLLCCSVRVKNRKKRSNYSITSVAPITPRVNLSVTTANPHYSGLCGISVIQIVDAFNIQQF